MISKFTKQQIKFFVVTLNTLLAALFFYPLNNPEIVYIIVATYCGILFFLIHNDIKTFKLSKEGFELSKESQDDNK